MYIYLTFKISFATHYRVALLFLNPGPAMNNLRKLLIFGLIVQVFATFLLFGSADSKTADVPYVENWKEIIYFSEDSNNDKNDQGKVFIRWFEDPRGNGYSGMVLYQRINEESGPVPIVKSWNFKEINNGGYDWSNVLVALWLDDKGWFIGDVGERLIVSRKYKDGKTISITYTFEDKNSSVFKTIYLEPLPNTLEQKPYPNSPK